MTTEIKIADFVLNSTSRTFIIAELSANHLQSKELAIESIKAIKLTGADAVKIQTYRPDTITIKCEKDDFYISQETAWDGQYLYDLYEKAYTPWEWHQELKTVAESLGLVFFSSPFDLTAVDFLEELGVPAYKIASFEITDIPLIKYVASKGKPLIISTGIATLSDIERAVTACHHVGNNQVILLKCTSSYPAPYEEANLKTIQSLKETFKTIVGLSDHTMGATCPIVAVSLGAKVIEKHFILDRALGGPDSSFSMMPEEFKQMVDSIRIAEKAIGEISYKLSPKVLKSREHSRSLYFVCDINAGDVITKNNLRSIRPGFGLHPSFQEELLGKRARVKIDKGTRASWDLLI